MSSQIITVMNDITPDVGSLSWALYRESQWLKEISILLTSCIDLRTREDLLSKTSIPAGHKYFRQCILCLIQVRDPRQCHPTTVRL